jgi:hypothetical protein
MAQRRSHVGYYIGVVILAALLVGGIALVVAMITRPGDVGASVIAVTDRLPVACNTQDGATTCFETLVTNNGTADGTVECSIESSDAGEATFVDGNTTTQIVLGVDQSVHLRSIVTGAGDKPTAPSVSCRPVPL